MRNYCLYSLLVIGLLLISTCSKTDDSTLFSRVSAAESGLTFANRITEDDTFNILEFEYVYNGGGVGAADFNGDGLTDLYFTGNTTPNQLYLNTGNLRFVNVTDAAGVATSDRWCSGVSIVDINADGRPDIYVGATVYPDGARRANLLYLNQGNQGERDGVRLPKFTEVAGTCGLADTSHTTHAAFLDYDRDGDLDLYVLVNEMDDRAIPNRYLPKLTDGSGRRNDKLYRNDGPADDGLPRFTDVTRQANILKEGYGLGLSVCDINQDGWPDIYVTNDYLSNDLLWINNRDGTFTDRAETYFKHTAYSAMGHDVADLNNDGLDDIVAVDMFPETNLRRKSMMPPNNYTAYLNNERFGYQPQFTRNVLQLGEQRSDTTYNLRDVGVFAGIAGTDWSWSPLAADVDNDGDRDLLITNGFPKDVTDRDFMDYNVQFSNLVSLEDRLAQIPSVRIANYGYENDGQAIPTFTKRIVEWGLDHPSLSNGAAYADLDNDGDLDYVVNNINDSCFLFRNDLHRRAGDGLDTSRWVRFELIGEGANPDALGARLILRTNRGLRTAFNHPVRGFLSSVADVLHFGLAPEEEVQEVIVRWPDGSERRYPPSDDNRVVQLNKIGGEPYTAPAGGEKTDYLVPKPEWTVGLPEHRDSLFIDFNVQPLLPHLLSEYGPGLAVGDVNGDGLEDLYRSGSHFFRGELLLQEAGGGFRAGTQVQAKPESEELGSLLFDADGDGDLDLYLVGGGSEFAVDRPELRDQLLLNDGEGNFAPAEDALPGIQSSGSCVRAADFDRDGDLDLFVGGRLHPGRYPQPVASYLLINDGRGAFTAATDFELSGLVTDALWTDYNADGWVDLLVAGHGAPLRVYANREGRLADETPEGLLDHSGWWNSLTAADFDRDGDIDYAVGNLGANNLYHQAGTDYVAMYGADFDGNGGYDLLLASRALGEDGAYQLFPHHQRTDTEKQIIGVKQLFPRHEQFGRATMDEVLARFPDVEVTKVEANFLRSAWIENRGGGDFYVHDLPRSAQLAPIFGLQAIDIDADGYEDLLAVGNDYGSETGMGMQDGLNGLALRFDPQQGAFVPLATDRFFVPGDGRSLSVIDVGGKPAVIATENQGPTRAFALPETSAKLVSVSVRADAQCVRFTLADGRQSLAEVYYGSGYLSQRSRTVWLPAGSREIEIVGFDGVESSPQR
jgi:hypothetical protein